METGLLYFTTSSTRAVYVLQSEVSDCLEVFNPKYIHWSLILILPCHKQSVWLSTVTFLLLKLQI